MVGVTWVRVVADEPATTRTRLRAPAPELEEPSHVDAVAIEMDLGTLSGGAVVDSGTDGRELGSAVHGHVHGHGVAVEWLPFGEPWPALYGLAHPLEWRLAMGLQMLEEGSDVYAAMGAVT